DHREQPLACRLPPRVLQLTERRPRRERPRPRSIHLERAVIRVPEDDVALREAEAITDAVELGARLHQELARVLEAADGGGDHRQQDQTLRPAQRIAGLAAPLTRFAQELSRARVLSEEIVDLAEDDHRLRAARAVAELLEIRERERHLQPP